MQAQIDLFPCFHGAGETPYVVVHSSGDIMVLSIRGSHESLRLGIHYRTFDEMIAFGESIVAAAVQARAAAVPDLVPDPFMPNKPIDLDMVAETMERR